MPYPAYKTYPDFHILNNIAKTYAQDNQITNMDEERKDMYHVSSGRGPL